MDDLKVLLDALPQEHPDPNGDVQLHIEGVDSSLSLLASSTTLSAASPYFKAMLSSNFKEGQVPEHGPRVIELKEDDPYAVVLVCNAMHFVDLGDIRVSFSTFEQVTIVADKYRLVSCLAAWARIWLRQQYQHEANSSRLLSGSGRCWHLLRIAYLFGDHNAFYDLSKMIIYRTRPEDEKELSDSHLANTIVAELPFLVEDTIDAVRTSTSNRIYDALEEVISKITTKQNPCRVSNPHACRRDATILRFMRELQRSIVWPRPECLKHSVASIMRALLQFDDLERFLELEYHSKHQETPLMYTGVSWCVCGPRDLLGPATVIWHKENDRMKGLCLACIKATLAHGRPLPMFEHSNCRAANLRERDRDSRDSHDYRMSVLASDAGSC